MATERAAIPVLQALLRTHGTRIADATYTSSPCGTERVCQAESHVSTKLQEADWLV